PRRLRVGRTRSRTGRSRRRSRPRPEPCSGSRTRVTAPGPFRARARTTRCSRQGGREAASRPETLAIRANEEAASALLDQDVAEARAAEQEAELALRVVEDRAVVDHFVAKLPDRPFEPVPAREA